MYIGFEAKRLFNNYTGLGNYSRTTIDILLRNDPELRCALFTPRARDNAATRRFLTSPRCQLRLPGSTFLPPSLWRTFAAAADVQRSGVSLFHGLSNELPAGLGRRGVPTLVTIHDVAFRTFTQMYRWHDRVIYDRKWHYACHHADHIVAVSHATRRDVLRFYGVDEARVSVVYQPVQDCFYTPLAPAQARRLAREAVPGLPADYMLYVGSVNSRKNLLGVAQAMELLPPSLRIPLVVVGGGGSYKREVRQYVAARGLDPLFLFAPPVESAPLLQGLYASARLFVYPSFYEGFGLPVVEAALQGCPVVASSVSSLPEAAGPSALLPDPSSADDIAHALERALTDSGLRAAMGREGEAYARRMFDPDAIARQLLRLYRAHAAQ